MSRTRRVMGVSPRDEARRLFFRSPRARLAARVALWPWLRGRTPNVGHLAFYAEGEVVGPLQRDEALLLFALTRVLRPRTVLEIGFLGGQGAFNFLQALEPGAQLHSVDVTEFSEEIADHVWRDVPGFAFHRASQNEIGPEMVDGRPVDLAFLDASHDLGLNQETFRRLAPMVASDGMIVVHDTGTWPRDQMSPDVIDHAMRHPIGWISETEYQHQRDERLFVNWVMDAHPEWTMVHLHSLNTVRHGMTILQRRRRLPVDPPASSETSAAAGR